MNIYNSNTCIMCLEGLGMCSKIYECLPWQSDGKSYITPASNIRFPCLPWTKQSQVNIYLSYFNKENNFFCIKHLNNEWFP